MRLCGRVVACCISVLLVIICEVLVFHRHAGQEYARTKDGTVYTHRERKMSGTASSENRAPLISRREKETEEHQQQR